ncbi:hypothetical protein OHA21_50355 [Actinoplanes sp. NBC_00393]|uniref:hypothetical protein n=1 Tax=Actinoplanes sp. NBC_00393 TaxID=2975953 RepID=UPI002E1C4B05
MNAIEEFESSFEHWEHSTRYALGEYGIGYHHATPLIEEAREHHAASGQRPVDVLGTPAQFAADVAAANPAALAGRDTSGKNVRDHFSDGLFVMAFLGALVAVIGAWVAGGFTIPVTVAGLTGVLVLALAVLAGCTPGALRAAGRPRLAPWGLVLTGVLVVAGASAFTLLPRTRIGEFPALVLLAISLVACWWLTRPGPAPAEPLAWPGAEGHDPRDPDAWFARLKAVLIGRFDVPPGRAAELVAESRAHVAEAGALPSDEFPSLDGYARELPAGESVRTGPWWRGATAALLATLFAVAWWLFAVVEAVVERRWWVVVLGVLALPLAVSLTRRRYRAWRQPS